MSEIIKRETISRRSAFSLFGKAAALVIAAIARRAGKVGR
jgi:hypothetical protein